MGGELLSFDEALAELQMATHELRSLVAQGGLRAFRKEASLQFRRTGILHLKKNRESQPAGLVIGPEEPGEEAQPPAAPPEGEAPPADAEIKSAKDETDETELLSSIGQEGSTDLLGVEEIAGPSETAEPDTAQTVVPSIEIADEDMIDATAQTVVPTIATEEQPAELSEEGETAAAPTAPSLLPEEDEATEMATQEISPSAVAAPSEEQAPTQAEDEPLP